MAADLAHLIDLLDRIDTQIDECNHALNAAQPPAPGKVGIYRDKPVHNGIAGYPRVGEWSRARSGKWMFNATSNNYLTRRAKSTEPFDKSFRLVQFILSELSALLEMRSSIMTKLGTLRSWVAGTRNIHPKLNEIEMAIGVTRNDARKLYESKWEIDSEEIGY